MLSLFDYNGNNLFGRNWNGTQFTSFQSSLASQVLWQKELYLILICWVHVCRKIPEKILHKNRVWTACNFISILIFNASVCLPLTAGDIFLQLGQTLSIDYIFWSNSWVWKCALCRLPLHGTQERYSGKQRKGATPTTHYLTEFFEGKLLPNKNMWQNTACPPLGTVLLLFMTFVSVKGRKKSNAGPLWDHYLSPSGFCPVIGRSWMVVVKAVKL